MKNTLIIVSILLFIFGCSKQTKISKKDMVVKKYMPNTYLKPVSFSELPDIYKNNFNDVVNNFIYDCKSSKTRKIYGALCKKAKDTTDAKKFVLDNFSVYKIYDKHLKDKGLLTGYYEAQLEASLKKSKKYKYPLYETPKDLITVDLSSIYPELKHYRLRGKLKGNKIIPYNTRGDIKRSGIDAKAICYCKSKVDRFFLEVQGSGKIVLDDNSTIYVGYANQNGHKYRSIGRYLIKKGEILSKNISLQTIRAWLKTHPKRVDEVLNQNRAMVFFRKRDKATTGALGLELTPKASVAVDRKYIHLGSMLYLSSKYDSKSINRFVFAQDVGGAIKGAVRADYFLGGGKEAMDMAGRLKSPLNLWIILPKERYER